MIQRNPFPPIGYSPHLQKDEDPLLLSVIIPTRNRASILKLALESIARQTLSQQCFETIIVDNGSTDETEGVVGSFVGKIPNLRYFYEETPGLHVGRHKGLKESRADILVYADDDIEAFPTWLEAIAGAFEDERLALAGGKILPKFESQPPEWLSGLWSRKHAKEKVLIYLSTIDLGDGKREIAPRLVFGCNFAIRKQILIDAGGFHPDAMPESLIRFRGDGETYVAEYIARSHHKSLYDPMASVFHSIPRERMTVDYFSRRAYKQGVSDSYTAARQTQGKIPTARSHMILSELKRGTKRLIDRARKISLNEIPDVIRRRMEDSFLRLTATVAPAFLSPEKTQLNAVYREVDSAYQAGYAFHQREMKKDPELVRWVLKSDYWDAPLTGEWDTNQTDNQQQPCGGKHELG